MFIYDVQGVPRNMPLKRKSLDIAFGHRNNTGHSLVNLLLLLFLKHSIQNFLSPGIFKIWSAFFVLSILPDIINFVLILIN